VSMNQNGWSRGWRTIVVALWTMPLVGHGLIMPEAEAQDFSLAWDRCRSEGGTTVKASACDANNGHQTLVGTLILSEATPVIELELEIMILGSCRDLPIPDWWKIGTGGCREGALSLSHDLSDMPQEVCMDPAFSPAWRYIQVDTVRNDPFGCAHRPQVSAVRLRMKVGPLEPVLLEPGEYLAFKLLISNAKSMGPGSCTGCCCGRTFVVTMCRIWKTPYDLQNIFPYNWVQWQSLNTYEDDLGCAATPVQNRSWGRIRSIYR